MGILTALNCLLLTLGPVYLVVITKRISARSLLLGALLYCLAQISRLVILAAAPIQVLTENYEPSEDIFSTFLLCVDAVVAHMAFTTFRKFLSASDAKTNVLCVGTGWSLMEVLATRGLPIYSHACEIGFDVEAYLACLLSNTALPRNLALVALCLSFCRNKKAPIGEAVLFGIVAAGLCICKNFVVSSSVQFLAVSVIFNLALFSLLWAKV